MQSARRMLMTLIAWSLMFPFAMVTLAAVLQVGRPDPSAATPIEQALIEHVCSVIPSGGAPESNRYLICLRAQLLALRSDFGRDLSRLSASERRTLDAACNEIRTASGQDAYLGCLGAQLTALRSRRNGGKSSPPPPVLRPPSGAQADSPAVPASQTPTSSGFSALWIGAAALVVLVGAGGAVFLLKARRASHKCRVCGQDVPPPGGLCQKCRHQAAEGVRRVVAERAEHQRALEQDQKRLTEQEEEERRLKAQEEEDARLQQRQQQEQEDARKRNEEERRRQEEDRERRQAASVSGEAFDPYSVLEVPRSASQDSIRAAYLEAKEKSDPSRVSHLGVDVQEHFKAKLNAVERAYQMLTK